MFPSWFCHTEQIPPRAANRKSAGSHRERERVPDNEDIVIFGATLIAHREITKQAELLGEHAS